MIARYILVILLLLGAYHSRAQESMMSEISYPFLEKLIVTAKANYPRVKVYENQVKIANMGINKAKTDWFNIVSFTYLYSPTNTTTLVNPTYQSGYQVGISTSIGSILQKPGMVRVAKEQYKIAQLTQEEYNLGIEATVKQRYFAYVQAMSVLKWKTQDVSSADLTVKDIKYRFEKGEQSFDNYNRAQEFYSNAIQAKIQAEGAMLIAKSSLEEIVGVKLEEIK